MRSFGRRLHEERTRLGLSQEHFAEIGGVKRSSQHLYEKDVRNPDAAYLVKIHAAGADVGYLITGRPTQQTAGGPVISVAQALAAYCAVEEFALKHGEAASLQERQRLFEFLCNTMSTETTGAPELLKANLRSRTG